MSIGKKTVDEQLRDLKGVEAVTTIMANTSARAVRGAEEVVQKMKKDLDEATARRQLLEGAASTYNSVVLKVDAHEVSVREQKLSEYTNPSKVTATTESE
jgi:hypothetical protein